jgi:hypothetical protein
MRLAEDALGPVREDLDVALVIDPEAPDRHAVHPLDAGRIFVVPRHVIARARREDLDLRVLRQAFGDVTRVQFGAAVDVGAIPLHDHGKLHCAESGPSSSPESFPKSPASGPSKSVSGPSSSAASPVGSPCGGVAEPINGGASVDEPAGATLSPCIRPRPPRRPRRRRRRRRAVFDSPAWGSVAFASPVPG